jgi:hypothetical protein
MITEKKDNFYPLMKVCLEGEYGIVTNQFSESDGTYIVNGRIRQGVASKLYGVIRWDTNQKPTYEDWRGLWGSFIAAGGYETEQDYEFQFIGDDGTDLA